MDSLDQIDRADFRDIDDVSSAAGDSAPEQFPDLSFYFGREASDDVVATTTVQKVVGAKVAGLSAKYFDWKKQVEAKIAHVDLAPNLAEDIGSKRWFRGLGTMVGLSAIAIALWPNMSPLEARNTTEITDSVRDEFKSRMIMPLALGSDTGRRSGPTVLVKPLDAAPERPQIELVATYADPSSFESILRRAGLSSADVSQVTRLISESIPLEDIESGTRMDITLGRRTSADAPRPLSELAFRARFDLELAIERQGDALSISRNVIRVDDTPLRLRGKVGDSLYRSMRAAGAPASAVQEFIKALDGQINLDREVRSTDEFDMIVSYRRAATGERQAGKLMFAGLDRGGQPKTQLMRWGSDGQFYEASGSGEARGGLLAPVPGRVSSSYGMRRHPILGYRRMHAGLDFKASYGTPIVAVTDGTVSGAGRMGGCGIAVRLKHDNNISTRYCHMSRMAVSRGQKVRRGQVIGYVGSTGLSTGAHLHYEMYRGGTPVNPQSVDFVTRATLSGSELRKFREALGKLKTVEPGAALEDLEPMAGEEKEPIREIEKLDMARRIDVGGSQVYRGAP